MNRLKTLKLTIFMGLLVFFLPITSNAVKPYTVPIRINHLAVNFTDEMGHPLLTATNRTLVPLRIISEYLGYNVDWSKDTWNEGIQKVWITKENNKIEFDIGKTTAKVNGEERAIDVQDGKAVNTKVIVHNGRTYVPLRFIVEALGAEIKLETTQFGYYIQIITKEEVTYTNLESKFSLKNSELIPSGATLTYSNYQNRNGNEYVFLEYKYKLQLTGNTHIEEFTVFVEEPSTRRVILSGEDMNGQILSFNWNVAESKIQYDYHIPDITEEDKAVLEKLGQDIAAAYGL